MGNGQFLVPLVPKNLGTTALGATSHFSVLESLLYELALTLVMSEVSYFSIADFHFLLLPHKPNSG